MRALCTFTPTTAGLASRRGASRRSSRHAPARAFRYDVQEMEDDEVRRAREAEERARFKNNATSRRAFPKGIDPREYTLEQLAFISRKEQGIMPDMNDCSTCEGIGTLICPECLGTGINRGSQEARFDETVRLSSNSLQSNMVEAMLTKEGAPCWICRGLKHIGCTQCEGSGRRDFAENYICD